MAQSDFVILLHIEPQPCPAHPAGSMGSGPQASADQPCGPKSSRRAEPKTASHLIPCSWQRAARRSLGIDTCGFINIPSFNSYGMGHTVMIASRRVPVVSLNSSVSDSPFERRALISSSVALNGRTCTLLTDIVGQNTHLHQTGLILGSDENLQGGLARESFHRTCQFPMSPVKSSVST